jgi:hypothetical protein
MNIDSKFIFYISFSDNPEALINAVFLNNGAYFGLRGRQDHVNMTWGDIQLKSTSQMTNFFRHCMTHSKQIQEKQ